MERRTRIAYLVLCHDEPLLLRRTAMALACGEDRLFVHVDKKKDIAPFTEAVEGLSNVVFLENRTEIHWGGFHSIVATMELIRRALADKAGFNRLVLLQGKDYPLHSPGYIHDFFDQRFLEEFCGGENISVSENPKEYMRCCGFWYMDSKGTFPEKALAKLLLFLNTRVNVRYRRASFRDKAQVWDVYKGWAQIAITAPCAAYVLKVYDTNKAYNRFMKHRFPPDEIYIHTVIHNSEYGRRLSPYALAPRKNAAWTSNTLNLTYFEYANFVTTFKDPAVCGELIDTGALFFRKATLPDSEALLDAIDRAAENEKNGG